MSRGSWVALVGVVCLAWSGVRAEPVELPLSAEVTATRIAVDLRGGRLEVTFDADATPNLTVTDLNQSSNDEGFVYLEQGENSLSIGQLLGGDKIAPPLLVRLVLRPGAEVSVGGDRLQISVESVAASTGGSTPPADSGADAAASGESSDRSDSDRPRTDPSQERGAAAARLPPTVKVDVRNSVVRIAGVGASLKGLDSHFEIAHGAGVLLATLKGGDLQVQGFAGLLDLSGSQAEFGLSRAAGEVRFKLEGGSLKLADGAGAATGGASDATFGVERWRGGLELRGDDNRVELREVRTDGARAFVGGARGGITVDQFDGALAVDMDSGQLALTQAGGRATVNARLNSEVSITGFAGEVELTLTGESHARLHGVERTLRADVEYSRVEAETVGGLRLIAARATVIGRDVRGAVDVLAADCDLDLDLVASAGHPRFDLSGSTTARVALPSPCLIRVDGDLAATAGRLTVAGCEVQESSAPPQSPRRQGGVSPLVASTKLDEAAVLTIRRGS